MLTKSNRTGTYLKCEVVFSRVIPLPPQYVNSKSVFLLWDFYLPCSHFLLQAKFYFARSLFQSLKKKKKKMILYL